MEVPPESTVLAWVCRVPEPEIIAAAERIGVKFSPRRFRSLKDMIRIAYQVGVVLERRPARGRATPPIRSGRCAAWLHVGPRCADLWGLEDGRVAIRQLLYRYDSLGLANPLVVVVDRGLDRYRLSEWVKAYDRDGSRLHPASWLIPTAQVH